MALKTVDRFWKLVSKGRVPKLKDLTLKMHLMFGNTYICAGPLTEIVKRGMNTDTGPPKFGPSSKRV